VEIPLDKEDLEVREEFRLKVDLALEVDKDRDRVDKVLMQDEATEAIMDWYG
jgi:hypothetical protein